MLITKIYLAAMSRADISEQQLNLLPQFYLYVDEFQSFANESFANILSEARKYKLNLTMAHQYIEQMSDEVRAAVFGNVGTMIVFRVGAFDAEVLEKEFAPKFTSEDIVNLGIFQIYLKLMIDGVSSQPFSATTIPPIARQPVSFRDQIIELSRKAFSHARIEVEKEVRLQSGVQEATIIPAAPVTRATFTPVPASAPATSLRSENSLSPRNTVAATALRVENRLPQRPAPVAPTQQNRPSLAPSDGFSSLKDIAAKMVPRTSMQPEKKAGTEEHKQNLRAALSNVLNKQPQAEGKVPAGERVVGAKRTSEPAGTLPKANTPSSKQEVPEDVLRNILESN